MLKILQLGNHDIYIAWNTYNKKLELKLLIKDDNEISYNLFNTTSSNISSHQSSYNINEFDFNNDNHTFQLNIKEKKYTGYYYIDHNNFYLHFNGNNFHFKPKSRAKMESSSGELFSEMPGKVISVLKKIGDEVKNGETIFQVESMKMENNILASKSGKINSILIKINQEIKSGELLATIT